MTADLIAILRDTPQTKRDLAESPGTRSWHVLDLFAGLRGWSRIAEERGWDAISVDLAPRFDVSIHLDLREPEELLAALGDWRPDLVLASPPCETFSVLRIGRNWTRDHQPRTEAARLGRELVEATVEVIRLLEPAFWVIENPRAKLRRLPVVEPFERRTVTYCQLGHPSQKPTDLWGGFPPSLELPPPCKAGAPCHLRSPRGSRNGIQSDSRSRKDPLWVAFAESHGLDLTDPAVRAVVPRELARLVTEAAERDLEAGRASDSLRLWAS